MHTSFSMEEFALHASFCMQDAVTPDCRVLKRANSVVKEEEIQQLPKLDTPDSKLCRFLAYGSPLGKFETFVDLSELLRKSGVAHSAQDTRADLAARFVAAGKLTPADSFLGLQMQRVKNVYEQADKLQACSQANKAADMGAQEEKDKQKASRVLQKLIAQAIRSGFSGWDASKFSKKDLQLMMLHTWQWTSDNPHVDKPTVVAECRRQIEQHWEELKSLTVEPEANTEERRASCRRKLLDPNPQVADLQAPPTKQPEPAAKRRRISHHQKSTYIQERRELVNKKGWSMDEAIGILHGEA